MDAIPILTIAFLVGLLANALDWLFTWRRKFLYAPRERGLGMYFWSACYALIATTAIACQIGWVPSSVMPLVAIPPMVLLQFVSIWARHTTKQPLES